MNWLNVFGVALGAVVMWYALLKVERRALWVVVAMLVAPALVLMAGWAALRAQWAELAMGLAAGSLAAAAWWQLAGRRQPRHTSDAIKVWGQESAAKTKKQEAAALQAEVERLRADAARMEAELRRLKGSNGKRQEPPEE